MRQQLNTQLVEGAPNSVRLWAKGMVGGEKLRVAVRNAAGFTVIASKDVVLTDNWAEVTLDLPVIGQSLDGATPTLVITNKTPQGTLLVDNIEWQE